MRRQIRPVPFAGMRIQTRLRHLAILPLTSWPRHLRLAHNMLVGELKLKEDIAVAVVLSSYSAAHDCARSIDQRTRRLSDIRCRERLRKFFLRVAKCANRLPAFERHALDRKLSASLHQEPIDSESINALLEDLLLGFADSLRGEPSLTVLRAVSLRSSAAHFPRMNTARLRRRFVKATMIVQADYSALPALDQRKIEATLTELRIEADQLDTADICRALSSALTGKGESVVPVFVSDLITHYTKTVAHIWSSRGIRAARARNELDEAYHGKFHRYADLILTSVVDPSSKRHDGDRLETKNIRENVTPERDDVKWLVSDHHVRMALAMVQKTTLPTP